MDNETYLFHQTPNDCARDLIALLSISPADILHEPFKGEGSFYNNFPSINPKVWSELQVGIDYKTIEEPYDWVITNPPFRLETGTKRVNSFWYLLDYYSQRARKGIAFLGNDRCFSSLTPKRINLLKQRGWGITKIIVCSIKKWRGRYFFIVLEKKPPMFDCLLTNY
jgi:hypothetical protein